MEAVPRLPMISFDLKVSTENPDFASSLKQYIANFYNEDPESYNTEISNLEALRNGAVRPSTDVTGCQLLKKYYCQLHFLKSRFPMEEMQSAAVYFSWKDSYSNMPCSVPDVRFELMCVLYNIGALHTQLGANDSRSSPDGLKMACTHFQCAAWAFQTIKENYHQMIPYISSVQLIHFMQQVCFAQAQECILEKSMMDNRKATITAKVAVQVVDHYRRALSLLNAGDDEASFSNFVGSKIVKEWSKYLTFKTSYHKCIALLFQGQQAEEQQKMGERVAFYQAACEQLEEARKISSGLKQHKDILEAIGFTSDVVEGKRKAAKNENEFIYHEEVPDRQALQEVKGASLVKGIAFSVNDPEVSGPDIFARLVPMEAHEAASLYSEKKAQKLRQMGELVESKDQALAEFMSSMQLEVFTQMRQATGLSQDLVDRAAALSARPAAAQDLIDSMGKLSNSYHEVESMLNEIQEFLKEEEENERQYQELMGKRPPSIIATDLSREAAKYREAHNKANDSNQSLHKAMMTHVANLKILGQPLLELQKQIPAVEMPNPNVDENIVKEMEMLIGKVDEMRNQRAMLWSQFREALHKDDITSALVTRQSDQPLDQLFQQELQKHQELANIIEQNIAAQENIFKAFVDAYARSMNTRKYLQDIIARRSSTVSALTTSFDTYEDLLAKANKGIEFYSKLETNVSKLLQRIKSASKVQQEEREQVLLKNSIPIATPTTKEEISNPTPKLKDYLDTRKKNRGYSDLSGGQYYQGAVVSETPAWPRPAPLGSEMNTDPVLTKNAENLDQRFASLRVSSQGKQAFTMTTDVYQPISSSVQNNTTSTTNMASYGYQVGQGGENYQTYGAYNQSQYYNYDPQNYHQTYTSNVQVNQPANVYTQAGYNQQVSQPSSLYTQNMQTPHFNQQATQPSNLYSQQEPVGQPVNYNLQVSQSSSSLYSHPVTVTQPITYNQVTYTQAEQFLNPYSQPTQTTEHNQASYAAPIQGYTQVGQENVYYPAGYGTSVSDVPKQDVQNYPNAYGSLEYATSVHPNLSTTNMNATYSSPTADVKSSSVATSNYVMSNGQNYPSYDSTGQYQYYYANYGTNYYGAGYGYPQSVESTPVASKSTESVPVTTKESNLDLLTGLDFTVNQAPLVPQPKPTEVKSEVEKKEKELITPVKIQQSKEDIPIAKPEKVINRKPLNNSEVQKLCELEIDRYEKFVDVLINKTLSGPTNLELKWKEILDKQEMDKKAISVARCYPMKNKYPDILPYDYCRVELKGTKDDYINASHVKDISYYSPPFIITQSPNPSTILDFWTMITEQQVELIISLLNDTETGSDIYWPQAKGRELTYPGMIISLISQTSKPHWIERLISIGLPEKRDSRVIIHLQFTSWPGSLFPTSPEPFVSFTNEVANLYMQQRSGAHPIVVHCNSGIGRSGLLCALVAAILEVTSNPTVLPDLVTFAVKLSACRRNAFRDREHLKFGYEAILTYMKQVIAQGDSRKMLKDVGISKTEEKNITVEDKNSDDPLNSLDPFWASKKGGN